MNDVIRALAQRAIIQYKAILSSVGVWERILSRARRVPGEWYVMPRHVARYFMRRRHHRRRIPAASRYISGCTVNPSSPAVRQLHRGRSSEFRERSPSSARLLSPSLVLAMCVCVCPCTSVSDRVSSLLFLVVARVRLSFSLSTRLPYRRPFAPYHRWFGASFPSWILSAIHGSRYSRFRESITYTRRLERLQVIGIERIKFMPTVVHTVMQLLDILSVSLLLMYDCERLFKMLSIIL